MVPPYNNPMIDSMIAPHIREQVRLRLRKAETEHDVKVLLAVESGSRAWGFESPNSDYDARFIYAHKPNWYLSVGLEEQRDVIDYPILDDLDVNGWDVRKALRLFWKSNPGFVEWIQSPIVYESFGSLAESARALLPEVYSVESGIYHYRSMAKTNYRGYLQAELVPLKKYFYVMRPLLAVRWLERFGQPAPIEFGRLLAVIEDQVELLETIHTLLETKRRTPELGLSPQLPVLGAFIERELERIEALVPQRSRRQNMEPWLSEMFRAVLAETWG